MDTTSKSDSFYSINARIAAFREAMHTCITNGGSDILLHDYTIPEEWLGLIVENGVSQNDTDKLRQSCISLQQCAAELLEIRRTSNSNETNTKLKFFELTADNLLLQLQLLEARVYAGKDNNPGEDEKFDTLAASVGNLNTLVQEQATESLDTKDTLKRAIENSQFQYMVMHSPIAMCVFKSRDLYIEIANDTMLQKIWRKNFNEVQGKRLLEVFPELKEQKYIQLLYNVMDTGIAYTEAESVAYVDSHDGRKTYYFDYEYAPLRDTAGIINGIMCTVSDVTDKVKARDDKEFAQKKQAQLIKTLPVAMYTIDAEGYIDNYNAAAVQLWGTAPEKGKEKWCGAYKTTTLEGIPVTKENCPIAQVLKSGRSLKDELYIYRKDGERRHIMVNPQPLFDEYGAITGASDVLIDITERIAAHKAHNQSEAKFSLLARSIPQFIWTVNSDLQPDYISESLYNYTGLTEKQLIENGFSDMVHPDDVQKNNAAWENSVKTGEELTIEHRLRRHDGEYRWYLCRAIAQKDETGAVVQWIGTSTDIDQQKAFQENLEQLVNERTAALSKANAELENMNKKLSSFAYISSHDLQEPLRKIQTFGSIIMARETDNLSEAGKKNITRMQIAANRMTALINDLLAYSRTNTTEDSFEKVDLNVLLQEVAGEFNEKLEGVEGTITISKMPVIDAIYFQMQQLFTNLISNALKFAKDDTPPVIKITSEIKTGKTAGIAVPDPHKDYLHITVQDNGIGFSPEYATKIFEVFQRLHGKDEYEGTGIGLAICMKIAENHNAVLNASSQPGEGAVFNFYIPL